MAAAPVVFKVRDAGAFALGWPDAANYGAGFSQSWNRVCIDSLYPVSRCGVPEDSAPLSRGPAGWGPSTVTGSLTPEVA